MWVQIAERFSRSEIKAQGHDLYNQHIMVKVYISTARRRGYLFTSCFQFHIISLTFSFPPCPMGSGEFVVSWSQRWMANLTTVGGVKWNETNLVFKNKTHQNNSPPGEVVYNQHDNNCTTSNHMSLGLKQDKRAVHFAVAKLLVLQCSQTCHKVRQARRTRCALCSSEASCVTMFTEMS